MKKILVLLPVAALFSCGTPKTTKSSAQETASNRLNSPGNGLSSNSNTTDTITVTGTEYLPIVGKSETGTRINLEGAWVLQSMNGSKIPGTSGINTSLTTKAPPPGTEIRRDSVTSTKTINGVTHTTTEVQIDRMGNPLQKITPSQGSNYHIPEKPGLNFYGSNETFSGFTGCNKISGRYTLSDTNSISFHNAAPSTKMVCIGDYDENAFLKALHSVTKFKGTNNELQLMEGDKVVLVFTKNN